MGKSRRSGRQMTLSAACALTHPHGSMMNPFHGRRLTQNDAAFDNGSSSRWKDCGHHHSPKVFRLIDSLADVAIFLKKKKKKNLTTHQVPPVGPECPPFHRKFTSPPGGTCVGLKFKKKSIKLIRRKLPAAEINRRACRLQQLPLATSHGHLSRCNK